MTDKELEPYYTLYGVLWKLLRRGLTGMTKTTDMEKFADELRTEAQAVYEAHRELNRDAVLCLVDNTLKLFYRAYESLPRPEREAEQMDIFTIGKKERAQAR